MKSSAKVGRKPRKESSLFAKVKLTKNSTVFIWYFATGFYLRAPSQNNCLLMWRLTKSFHFNQYTHYACFINCGSQHCVRTFLSAGARLLFRHGCSSLTEQHVFNPLPICTSKKFERLTAPPVSLFLIFFSIKLILLR